MYERFFSLDASPFVLTPDPRFLFRSRGHHDILTSLLYGIASQKGIMALIGDVGTGKTTLCRALLQELPKDVQSALILNPHLSDTELLGAILDDLGLERRGATRAELMLVLVEHLLAAGAAGRTVVVILDEAQQMSIEALEQIRILSNLETPSRKLLQIVLAGQSELADRLRRRELRQLDQRIGIRCQLQPLSRNETFRYIEHRLRAAGLAGSMPFTRAAIARIYSRSRGTPRVVNLVCDRALLAAYSTGARVIDDRLVRLAIRNLWGRNPVTLRARVWRRPVAVAAAAVGITVGVGAGTVHWRYARNPASHASLGIPAATADVRATGSETAVAIAPAPPPIVSATADPVMSSPARSEAASSAASLLGELIRLWGIPDDVTTAMATWSRSNGLPDVVAVAERYQLSATYLPQPSLAELRAIGLPGLLVLRGTGGEQFYLLRRAQGDAITLLGPAGEEIRDGAERLGATPPTGVWILWRNVDQLPADPLREATPTVIATVALRLYKLGYLTEPLPTTYEPRLGRAVRGFQRAVGLPEDGLLGPRTTLALARVVAGRFGPTILDGQP